MMTNANLQEALNAVINKALANQGSAVGSNAPITQATIVSALNNASAAVTALSGVTHSREIQDPGSFLNPSQP